MTTFPLRRNGDEHCSPAAHVGRPVERETEIELAGPKRVVRAELISLEDLKMEPVDWIWTGWLARGKIHLIAGVPEAGKTSIALKLAATLSSGAHWPDGTIAEPGNGLIWTGEDDPAQTVKPRLIQMGADAKKIAIVMAARDEDGKLRPFNPSTDLPGLASRRKICPAGWTCSSLTPSCP
jgi:putative DNA primase/helicase